MGDVRVGSLGFQPVDTGAAKRHLRVAADDTTQDSVIETYVAASLENAEEATKRALAEQTRRLTLGAFPTDREGNDAPIVIPRPPLRSITSITYRDADGATQTLSPSSYVVDTSAFPGRVFLAPDASWPDTQANHPAAVTVDYLCGPELLDDVPARAVAAILLTVGDLYENREAQIVGTIVAENPTVTRLLSTLRLVEAY